MLDMYREVYELKNNNKAGVLVTVVQRKGHGPANVGKKILVSEDGTKKGTVGGGQLEYFAIEKAKEILDTNKNALISYDFTGEDVLSADVDVDMICGGLVSLYYEYIPCNPKIFLFGAGHVGKSLAHLLEDLDYETVIVDDREEIARAASGNNNKILIGDYEKIIEEMDIQKGSYIVITGYTHEIDHMILKAILKKNCSPKYIGLLASKKKFEVILGKIKKELNMELNLSMLHAPVGLDLGGDTPEEIAISVMAEIQAIRYNREGNKHLACKWS